MVKSSVHLRKYAYRKINTGITFWTTLYLVNIKATLSFMKVACDGLTI